MATITWSGIRNRVHGASRAHDENLRRVAVRLAGQTVVLLLVMLIILEVVVYVITQQTLRGSLETTLRDRANHPPGGICHIFTRACSQPGSSATGQRNLPPGPGNLFSPQRRGFGQGGPPPAANQDDNPSDVSSVFVTPTLHIQHTDGGLGKAVLDWSAIRKAIRTQRVQSYSVHKHNGIDYLVYTKPVVAHGTTIGAIQSSISEQQFEGAMHTVLQTLLVVALLGLVGSGGISAVMAQRALQPIRTAMQRQRDFVADAAHELRTPLAIQRTVGEVAMSDPSESELQATVVQMLGENQHLTRLVEDLSLLARADTNAVAIDRRPVDISSLVAETAAELRYLAEEQGITLDADVQEHIRGVGDILRLRQLLLILIDNALKHTPSGGTVSVQLALTGGRARLRIADSGAGIDQSDLPHIFDRFYRADQARTGEGTGLGLAIAKWIVDAHGGQIQAGNASPHGAVFTVTLPHARRDVGASMP